MRLKALLLAVCIAGAACVPADVPPQLEFTAGAPFVVDDDRYESAFFSVRVPQGWRIVSAPAEQPDFVIFVAPDDNALMQFSVRPIDPTPALATIPTTQQNLYSATHDGIYGVLVSDSEQADTFTALFESTLASLRTPTNR